MTRIRVEAEGIVQGVGFRPFIHRLARRYALAGWVRNTPAGVEMELEGDASGLLAFLEAVKREKPVLARLDSLRAERTKDSAPLTGFRILPSTRGESPRTFISPDVGICPDCLRELFQPGDRRYRYPFINCTNCGPRFTITQSVPYDRPGTTMAPFPMCEACALEYEDIQDRRYHAQPDCCPECGPRLIFCDGAGKALPGDPTSLAQACIQEGGIVAVKGLGGIHLACLTEEAAVNRLRGLKHRDRRPFALMCRDIPAVRALCELREEEEALLSSPRRPILLLKKRRPGLTHLSPTAFLGIMLPYTPLHYLLMEPFQSLVMTSANLFELPVQYKNHEAIQALSGVADGFLLHDRDIHVRCDDSLAYCLDTGEYFLRRSRGYVPEPTPVPAAGGLLACGAEQKATFALSKRGAAFLSQHIGDLKNAQTLEHYQSQIAHFERIFDITPLAVACDLHPDYLSTEYAQSLSKRLGLPLFPVQHHHAHLAACMADNGLAGKCLGLVWDGTGLGEDGTIWGGELLLGDYEGYERLGSIRPIPLPGGDLATKELYRVGYALALEAGAEPINGEMANIARQLRAGVNVPVSSGMGRLFDGVSMLLGLCDTASYEGEGAVLLEAAAIPDEETYPVEFYGELPRRFDWRPMVRRILWEREAGISPGVIAARFMNTLAAMAQEALFHAAQKSGVWDVVLSGGVFQNLYLLFRLRESLALCGFSVYHHHRVSCNDEGLALGQLMVADARRKGR